MGLSHSPSIVTNGLVLCLDAANPKSYPGSGTTWTDLSGNVNNGTLTNGPTYSSANGGSIVFDGVDDYASSAISLSNANMAIEMTFKINSFAGFVDVAVLDNGTNGLLIELGGNNGVPNTNGYLRYYGFGISVSDGLASSSQYILDSKIHTSVLTVNSSSATSYFDGVLQGTESITSSTTFTRLVLANDLLRGGRACGCNIYQVKIYNRALSAAEIQQNFNALRGRYSI
jgi:hypothetical protein